jgi:chemotaxis protein MotB
MLVLRQLASCAILASLAASSGCLFVPKAELYALKAQHQELARRNRAQIVEIENLRIHSRNIENQLMRTEEELALMEEEAGLDRNRLENYQAEREQLREQFLHLANGHRAVSPEQRGRLAEISQRYPHLRFDPQTGVSKLDTDFLFDVGEAELKPGAEEALGELARVLKSPDCRDLKIFIVGHTDDRLVAKKPVREKYPNNFHLSARRALTVCDELRRLGLTPERMGVAGFGPYQPIAPNQTSEDRQKNRRVELFVMAPDVPVIGWTETTPTLY